MHVSFSTCLPLQSDSQSATLHHTLNRPLTATSFLYQSRLIFYFPYGRHSLKASEPKVLETQMHFNFFQTFFSFNFILAEMFTGNMVLNVRSHKPMVLPLLIFNFVFREIFLYFCEISLNTNSKFGRHFCNFAIYEVKF